MLERRRAVKDYALSLVLILVATLLAGCGGAAASSPTAEATAGAMSAVAMADDAEGGTLPDSSRLALGTLMLEGTADAVTPEQANTLLLLWQALQSGGLQNEAETAAVLKQLEGAMTAEQLAAIAAMEFNPEDLGTWMQEQGTDLAPPSGAAAGSDRLAPPEGMSEEDMAAMRATAEAGGMTPGGRGARGAAGGGGQLAMMAQQVIELLTDRAAE
jgi:hypothetical protein